MASSLVHEDDATTRGQLDAMTVALRLIAGVMLVGLLYLIGWILIPLVLAVILSIALSPAASWLERRGLGRGLANGLCCLAILGVLLGTVGLIIYQAGTIVQDSARYLDRFSHLLADASRRTGGERLIESLGGSHPAAALVQGKDQPEPDDEKTAAGAGDSRSPKDAVRYWDRLLRQSLTAIGRWAVSGLGGLLGFVAGVVLFLSLLFYILETRAEWLGRIKLALYHLGLRPRDRELEQVRREIITFLGCLALVSLSYVVIVSLALWAIGVPQPLLWGVLAGLLEVVPYFGPLIAAALPTVVALSLGSGWQPLAVVGVYVVLHTIEGYVVTPLLYGGAVRVDPVLVLVAVLFFGWLWGPLGLAVAMPMTILLRGLLVIAPDTPALDALMDAGPPSPGAAPAR